MSSEYKTIQTPHGLAQYQVRTCDQCGKRWTDADPTRISSIGIYAIFRDDWLWKQNQAEGMLSGEACSVKCFRELMIPVLIKYYEMLAAEREEIL